MQRTGILGLQELPPELGQHALAIGHVPQKDLCSLSLTSSAMWTLASDPKLWTEMKVRKSKIREQGLVQLFSINRFRKIRKIDISNDIPPWKVGLQMDREKLLSDLHAIASSSVEDLNLENIDFTNLPAELLARTVSHLHKVNLNCTILTSEQILAVLQACISSPTLLDVSLRGVELKDIPAQILSKAVGHLHTVNLDGSTSRWAGVYTTSTTSQQILAVLEACISSPTLLDVSLKGVVLQDIPPQILAEAVGHLQTVNLDGANNLSSQRILAVLEACISSPTLLDVSLGECSFYDISPDMLAKAVGHLRKVNLDHTKLSASQILAVLKVCKTSSILFDVSLKEIGLSNSSMCLSDIFMEIGLSKKSVEFAKSDILGESVGCLQKVNLADPSLSMSDCLAVLKACISSTTLVELSLEMVNLVNIPSAILAKAVSHLQKINLDYTLLTSLQILDVLEACISSSTLVEASFLGCKFQDIPVEILVKAVKHLKKVNLDCEGLTNQQREAIDFPHCSLKNVGFRPTMYDDDEEMDKNDENSTSEAEDDSSSDSSEDE